jgi:Flp pilus assembly protein TadB
MEILDLLVSLLVIGFIFATGALYGWNLRERQAERRLKAFSEMVEERLGEEIENMIHIVIEQHDGMLFVYNKEDKSFMAQGKNRDEVENALQTRYPDKKFACDHETLVKYGFVS